MRQPQQDRTRVGSTPEGMHPVFEQAGTHALGTPIGAIGGAAVGALIGIAAGPVGSLAGATAGAVVGGLLASGAAAGTRAVKDSPSTPGTAAIEDSGDDPLGARDEQGRPVSGASTSTAREGSGSPH